MKKAQLTSFAMIGVAMIIIFGTIYYFSGEYAEQGFETEAQKIFSDIEKTGSIESYASSCLKKVSSEGIMFLGKQGLRLFEEQTNPEAPTPTTQLSIVDFNNYKISLAVSDAKEKEVPQYPYGFEKLFIDGEENRASVYGKSEIPALCQKGGVNDVEVTETTPGVCTSPIRPRTRAFMENSLQEQLQAYIENNLDTCVDKSFLKEVPGFVVDTKKPSVNVTMGTKDVLVEAAYPISVKKQDEEIIKFYDFQTTLPVRLSRIYHVADYLIYFDTKFLGFNVFEDIKKSVDWDENIEIKMENTDASKVITITDQASRIDGLPFAVHLAMPNRNPALEMIETAEEYKIGDRLAIEPKAYDPDDNSVLTIEYEPGTPQSAAFVNRIKQSMDETGNINYILAEEDKGLWRVKAAVADEKGKEDWQDLVIKVTD